MPAKGSERRVVRWSVRVMACGAIIIAVLALYVLSTGSALVAGAAREVSYQAHTTYSQPGVLAGGPLRLRGAGGLSQLS